MAFFFSLVLAVAVAVVVAIGQVEVLGSDVLFSVSSISNHPPFPPFGKGISKLNLSAVFFT